jgi:Endoplasmic Reticulum Oxidoreductin 1 (ERO1)
LIFCQFHLSIFLQIPQKIISVDQRDGNELFELDSWSRWDMPSNDYYDTQTFTESYTGYDGSSVWKTIHDMITFAGNKYNDDTWRGDFNKVVSGLHSLISAQVTRGIRDKIDYGEEFGIDEIWTDPFAEYKRRLSPSGETPLALENLYFTCMLLISAINKSKDKYISDYNSRYIDDHNNLLIDILNMPLFSDKSVAVPSMTIQKHSMYDPTDLWQARMRSRDLLRIMNCVQCNKCRFHGKISAMGIITAMKVIIGSDGTGLNNADVYKLSRVELSTMLTTLHKCTSAIQFCREMEQKV